jgi:hypothetical protein
MQKICILIFIFSFTITAFAQKKLNPTIGKKEFEISLFYHTEYDDDFDGQSVAGAQLVRSWSWKQYTKIGMGGLMAVLSNDPISESDVVVYGAFFGDITQFIGMRQIWSVSGQIGHGIFKRKAEEASYYGNGVNKYTVTAGMYYSFSFNYRWIISKKILMVISPAYTYRNFRHKKIEESYSPPAVYEHKSINKYSGPGIRLGIIF